MKRIQRIAVLFVVLAALWLGGLYAFLRAAETIAPPETLAPVDAIVVLTGGSKRIETGFILLKKEAGKKLYISGVQRGVEVKELMRLTRQESEDKIECCIAIGSAENTIENAHETAQWLETERYESFYLVTSNYHMARALLEFSKTTPDAVIIPYPVVPENADMKAWWRDTDFSIILLREYTKYLLEHLRYFLLDGYIEGT